MDDQWSLGTVGARKKYDGLKFLPLYPSFFYSGLVLLKYTFIFSNLRLNLLFTLIERPRLISPSFWILKSIWCQYLMAVCDLRYILSLFTFNDQISVNHHIYCLFRFGLSSKLKNNSSLTNFPIIVSLGILLLTEVIHSYFNSLDRWVPSVSQFKLPEYIKFLFFRSCQQHLADSNSNFGWYGMLRALELLI